MICPSCGNPITDENPELCPHCGLNLESYSFEVETPTERVQASPQSRAEQLPVNQYSSKVQPQSVRRMVPAKATSKAAVGSIFAVVCITIIGFGVSVPVSGILSTPWTSTLTSVTPHTGYAISTVTTPYTTTLTSTHSSSTEVESTDTIGGFFGCSTEILLWLNGSQGFIIEGGASVTFSWSATGPVDVYVRNSAQFNQSSSDQPPYTASSQGQAMGSLEFQVPSTNYYLFTFCSDTQITINNASYVANYVQTNTYTYAETNTYTITTTGLMTTSTIISGTNTTTTTCSFPFWNWLFQRPDCS